MTSEPAGPGPSGPEFAAPEETITCVDCGGEARLLTTWDEADPPRPGDLAVYRCVDCLDRWDVVLPGADGQPDPTDPS